MVKRNYDSSLARMAGNIAAGLVSRSGSSTYISPRTQQEIAEMSVDIARAILVALGPAEEGTNGS